MLSQKQIKKRIQSVKNIGKITRALEMVSASKVQKAQESAQNAKPFSEKIYELVQQISRDFDVKQVPLLRKDKNPNSDLVILVSTNKGLAGSLNSNLFRFVKEKLDQSSLKNHKFIVVGKKGLNTALKAGELVADFSQELALESRSALITKTISDLFLNESISEVNIFYNDFISALNQTPRHKKLLPILVGDISKEKTNVMEIKNGDKNESREIINDSVYTFEPETNKLLNELLPYYLEVQIVEILYEAEASEHSARMIAMKNASENARDLDYSLSLLANKTRQQEITTEINDIITAAETLK